MLLLERVNLYEEQLPKAWTSTGSPSLTRLEPLVLSTQDSGGCSYFLSDCLNNGQGRVVFMKRRGLISHTPQELEHRAELQVLQLERSPLPVILSLSLTRNLNNMADSPPGNRKVRLSF